jgi:DNA-binding transcriptional LysR family regulator
MELRQLSSFVVVAEEMNMGRAARRLHISQPPLSRRIRQLEEDLKVALFERRHQRLHLTVAGREFLTEARAVLRQTEHARRTAERAARGEVGRVDVGCVESAIASGILPRVVARYRRAYPGVECHLVEATSLRQVDALRQLRLDVGFVHSSPPEVQGLSFQSIRPGRLVVALAKDHPLARRRYLALSALAGTPILLWEREVSPARYDAVLAALRATGRQVEIVQHATLLQTLVALAGAGLGAAVIPDAYVTDRYDGVVYRSVPDLAIRMDLDIVWRSGDQSPALLGFMNLVRRLSPTFA